MPTNVDVFRHKRGVDNQEAIHFLDSIPSVRLHFLLENEEQKLRWGKIFKPAFDVRLIVAHRNDPVLVCNVENALSWIYVTSPNESAVGRNRAVDWISKTDDKLKVWLCIMDKSGNILGATALPDFFLFS